MSLGAAQRAAAPAVAPGMHRPAPAAPARATGFADAVAVVAATASPRNFGAAATAPSESDDLGPAFRTGWSFLHCRANGKKHYFYNHSRSCLRFSYIDPKGNIKYSPGHAAHLPHMLRNDMFLARIWPEVRDFDPTTAFCRLSIVDAPKRELPWCALGPLFGVSEYAGSTIGLILVEYSFMESRGNGKRRVFVISDLGYDVGNLFRQERGVSLANMKSAFSLAMQARRRAQNTASKRRRRQQIYQNKEKHEALNEKEKLRKRDARRLKWQDELTDPNSTTRPNKRPRDQPRPILHHADDPQVTLPPRPHAECLGSDVQVPSVSFGEEVMQYDATIARTEPSQRLDSALLQSPAPQRIAGSGSEGEQLLRMLSFVPQHRSFVTGDRNMLMNRHNNNELEVHTSQNELAAAKAELAATRAELAAIKALHAAKDQLQGYGAFSGPGCSGATGSSTCLLPVQSRPPVPTPNLSATPHAMTRNVDELPAAVEVPSSVPGILAPDSWFNLAAEDAVNRR